MGRTADRPSVQVMSSFSTIRFSRTPWRTGWLLLLLGVLPGCHLAQQYPSADEACHVIALRRLAQRSMPATDLMQQVPTADGRSLRLYAFPLLTSRCFIGVDVTTDKEGLPAVKARLDTHGRMLWTQLTAEYADREVAVTVDDVVRCTMVVPPPTGAVEHIVIPGFWNVTDAQRAAECAPLNYRILNNMK